VLLEDSDTDRFVTLACARLRINDQGTATLTLATAGHPAPLIVRVNGVVEQPEVSGALSGVLPELSYQEITIELRDGDLFLLYTDGIYEAKGDEGLFGIDRLRELLPDYAGYDPDAVCAGIEQRVLEYLNGKPHDDMALLALRCGD
jgi:serine phosphatase RsbU (regulator of sigma subunit)